ncbi:Hypothetical protein FKW44_004049, partial [Caligus rogercresseyi]
GLESALRVCYYYSGVIVLSWDGFPDEVIAAPALSFLSHRSPSLLLDHGFFACPHCFLGHFGDPCWSILLSGHVARFSASEEDKEDLDGGPGSFNHLVVDKVTGRVYVG